MPEEAIKHKVVKLVRKYSRQMDNCPPKLDAIMIASGNLDTALQAAKEYGCGDLARAVMAKEFLESKPLRQIIAAYCADPIGYVTEARTRIEKFKEYL